MINHFTDGYKLRDPLTLISCYVNLLGLNIEAGPRFSYNLG